MSETEFELPPEVLAMMRSRDSADRIAVRALGERIGYGRTMQLCEALWTESESGRGGAHTVGPCVGMTTACPHPENRGMIVGCEWCGGSGRLTQRVAEIALAGFTPPVA